VDASWTLPELVAEVAARIDALPAPRNGQVRAVPDERTVRYYVTLGLLDRPGAMRGRTALYGPKHAAQVVAIKRLQAMGRSLSEIQALWPTLDDATLAGMSGVAFPATNRPPARPEFWKRAPVPGAPAAAAHARAAELAARAAPSDVIAEAAARGAAGAGHGADLRAAAGAAVELRIDLAPHVTLSLSVTEGVAVSPADVRAIRAAAAPVLAELASRRLAAHPGGQQS
jgi:DNA-binding transcriptional MerR regulator